MKRARIFLATVLLVATATTWLTGYNLEVRNALASLVFFVLSCIGFGFYMILVAKQTENHEVSGWISVHDKLPDEGTPVVVLRLGKYWVGERLWDRPSYEDSYKEYWYWDDPNSPGQCWEIDEITHWMAPMLPKLPAYTEQKDFGESK